MTLPAKWVDELFTRLSVRYGRAFMSRWDGVDVALVKADWAQELAGFTQWPEAIQYALQNLPADKPAPTVNEFRALALRAPQPQREALPTPAANPERMQAELTRAAQARTVQPGGHRDWARRIVARHQAGERVSKGVLQMARNALPAEAGRAA